MINKERPHPTVETLHAFLEYNKDSGDLIWRPRPRHLFKNDFNHRRFNEEFSGKIAGTLKTSGYRIISLPVDAKYPFYLAHRIAWAMHHGHWPDCILDHINGVRSDNRIDNLRLSDRKKNSQNAKLHTTNTSGFTGVTKVKGYERWRAMMCVNGKNIHLGAFDNIEDAARVAKASRLAAGFDVNHGRQS